MKFSKAVTWFLSCVVLLFGAVSASATTTVKGSRSNSSAKAAICKDLACCKANPNAKYSDGQPCSAILSKSKNSGHATEKTTTVNTSKSNNLKEGAPGTPSPTAGPVAGTTINTTKSNSYREGQPKYVAARVLSQRGRRLTVQLSDGKTATVDSAGLNPIPRVGSTVSITESGGRWVIVTR
jgi:hypothetical protein